ncbi:MAG: hypothetical protein CMF50_01820 [Legionellales bacterium]|nr:hypothetical protein [Legionellales bacterium]
MKKNKLKKIQLGLIAAIAGQLLLPHVLAAASSSENISHPSPPTDTGKTTHNPKKSDKYPKGIKPIDPYQLSRKEIADYIGWVNDNCSKYLCNGYYKEPLLFKGDKIISTVNKAPVTITANQTELSQASTSILKGNVVVSQPYRRLNADIAYLNRSKETGKVDTVDAYGNVHLREPGKLVIGDRGHLRLSDNTGSLYDVIYRMTFDAVPQLPVTSAEDDVNFSGTTAWGRAKKIRRRPDGIVTISDASYTTCPPPKNTWHVFAKKLHLDKESGRGTAENATLYFHEAPVFYSPYFNFPLDNRRQSGFLFPTFGHSEDDGFELAAPFYWNIAPNYDATITPKLMTQRGVQLNGNFRYLTESSHGDIHGSILPQDQEFKDFRQDTLDKYPVGTPGRNRLKNDGLDRYFISVQDNTALTDHWSTFLYLNRASDDYYFDDFSSDPAQITDNQLINKGSLFYNDQHWHFTGNVQGYQTLHPVNQTAVNNQYSMLPQLRMRGEFPDAVDGINFDLDSEAVYFDKDTNPGESEAPVIGNRLYLEPGLSMPIYRPQGYLKPEVKLSATQYDLRHQVPGEDSSITRVLPIADIDAGLFFDRYFNFLGNGYQQTFEPRLFYLFVPNENQDDIPLFDTDVQPFTYNQLFRTNRFNGIDRIGDANQLSVAMTSRFLQQATGEEKLRASIGQIYYFRNRKVNIDTSTQDLVTLENSVPSDTPSSPIAGQLLYHINNAWNFESNIAWDPNVNETNNGNFFFQYMPDHDHIFNVGYVYLRGGDLDPGTNPKNSSNDLNQVDFSVAWPLIKNWKAVARWNYNISHNHPQTYFAGLEYDSCCWAIRTVIGREFNYLETLPNGKNHEVFDNKVYIEFVFKGLGDAGVNSATGLLKDGIPGYSDNFGMVNMNNITNIM